MKIALKIITRNVFEVFEVTSDHCSDQYVSAGVYKGATATIRRLYARDKGIPTFEVTIEKSPLKGWY